MIANDVEYQKACAELEHLEQWLNHLRQENPPPRKGLTKAGIRKMIANLQEELAVYEGSLEVGTERTEQP